MASPWPSLLYNVSSRYNSVSGVNFWVPCHIAIEPDLVFIVRQVNGIESGSNFSHYMRSFSTSLYILDCRHLSSCLGFISIQHCTCDFIAQIKMSPPTLVSPIKVSAFTIFTLQKLNLTHNMKGEVLLQGPGFIGGKAAVSTSLILGDFGQSQSPRISVARLAISPCGYYSKGIHTLSS